MKKKVLILLAILAFLNTNSALAAEPIIQAIISPNPIVISPGNDGFIQLTLKNSGTVASSRIKISQVIYDPDIIIDRNWATDLGPLAQGDSVTYLFKFKVSEKASLGLHAITFYIDYSVDSTYKTITPNVIINVQQPSVLELTSVEPSSLSPGEKTNIKFTILNKGNSPITNLVFSWSSYNNVILPLGSGNRFFIPKIDANSYYSISTNVSVDSNAAAGIYPIIVNLQYTDSAGINQNATLVAGIEIGGETDFDVSLQEVTGNTVSLSIANIGINPAKSVIITIPRQEGILVSGATSIFLGDLNPGDYTTTTFQVFSTNFTRNVTQRIPNIENVSNRNVTQANLGLRQLLVEISYTDTSGSRRIVQKEVFISDLSQFQTKPRFATRNTTFITFNWLYVGIGIAGVIIILIFLNFLRGKKKWDLVTF